MGFKTALAVGFQTLYKFFIAIRLMERYESDPIFID